MAAPLYTTASGLLFHAGKILVVTVGLPARGKTHISRALERYLRWLGVKTTVVSLGDYRRKTLGGAQQIPSDYFTMEGEKSAATKALRASVSAGCEQLLWRFFESGGQVAIYDANNGTRAARKALAERFDKEGIHVVFLESICDNKEIVEANIRSVKISSPDVHFFLTWDPERAVDDYYRRIRDHEIYYEPVEETDWPFIRIFNVGDKIEVNSGQSLIEHSYKLDSDLSPAGWEYAARLKDFVLERRAKALEARGMDPAERKLVIWTSARRRAHHTAWPFLTHAASYGPSAAASPNPIHSNPASRLSTPLLSAITNAAAGVQSAPPAMPALQLPDSATTVDADTKEVKVPQTAETPPKHTGMSQTPSSNPNLNANPNLPPRLFSSVKVVEKQQMSEINPGVWDGLSPDHAQAKYPDEWARFLRDPYAFRAPRAESYHDLCIRLEPILVELEREQEDLLIIGHASVIRCLLAYLIGLPASEIPAIEVARGDLLEVRPASYGVHSSAYHFWDGPGRRGSSGAGDGKGQRGLKGMGLGMSMVTGGEGVAKARPEGAKGKDKSRAGSASSIHTGTDSRGHNTMRGSGEDGREGAGGGTGVFSAAFVSDGESDTERRGEADKCEDEEELDGDEEGDDSDESTNFYENYAEDTKGKRKFDVEQ
ncbi:hypothetical protein EW145_g5362 [Phellinidium pouzarii]|uniref:6-phosphofructo-2-kinase domain-containing protein n=1 Tax=Phellinidium pouzarii TaxID=167371 RepID=A0A4S4L0E7_9AGAM|nr:hypothetical protein EW145_g5362 [Phellinidium pouzarii]